ncbi:MAG: ATP-dependent Clp protease proteolytic subunit [Firmicutes bacterium]|nr:ATP-dependent Clp protease proteolytic subunit [candidate division NPL-UPA2 bacterium]
MSNQAAPVVIRFFAGVDASSINTLLTIIDQKLAAGVGQFTLLISSPGGTVFHGLTAYNYLKGIPAEVVTHNFGSVDSIGVVMYCAGARRLSVPHARFLLHGVSAGFGQNERLEEKQLEERLKGLQIDMLNIARVIAANTGKSEQEVNDAMVQRSTLSPAEAKAWGLVHDIASDLFPPGAEVIAIQQQ